MRIVAIKHLLMLFTIFIVPFALSETMQSEQPITLQEKKTNKNELSTAAKIGIGAASVVGAAALASIGTYALSKRAEAALNETLTEALGVPSLAREQKMPKKYEWSTLGQAAVNLQKTPKGRLAQFWRNE